MWQHWMLACVLGPGAQAFAPAPIQWRGLPARSFFLGAKASPISALNPPHDLMIWDRHLEMSPNAIPRFIANADRTITWDAMGWCVEASGDKLGDLAHVSRCTGVPTQKWNLVSNGHGVDMIQLQDTNKCLDVLSKEGGLNGAPVGLAECNRKWTESWEFAKPIQQAMPLSSMRQGVIALLSMAALGLASLGARLWRWQAQSRTIAERQSGMPCNLGNGGVALTPTLASETFILCVDPNIQEIVPAVMTTGPTNIENDELEATRRGLTMAMLKGAQDSVVKILNSRQRPSWKVPWQMQAVENGAGSGAVITIGGELKGELFILTAAHVVSDTKYLQIQRGDDKYRAHITAICHETDLALLTVEDAHQALKNISPLILAREDELPRIFDKVHVLGFPLGGDAVSVTEGIVSRVGLQEYSHSLRPGLALTVDAAINSGNSGGPVLDTSTTCIVGVAFQKLVAEGDEGQGHAVPIPLIRRFLKEVESEADEKAKEGNLWRRKMVKRSNGTRGYEDDGFSLCVSMKMPHINFDWQTLESPALRQDLRLPDNCHSVLIQRLHSMKEEPQLQVGDVLTKFNVLDLDDLGFCDLFGRRLHFSAAQDLFSTGDTALMTVFRAGRELSIIHRMDAAVHFVPPYQYDNVPRFFVCGGLVFQPLTQEFFKENTTSLPHLEYLRANGHVTPERTEAVILTQVLSDRANAGYYNSQAGAVVNKVNGEDVRDLGHLIEMVRSARSEYDISGKEAFLRFSMEVAAPFDVVLAISDLKNSDIRVSDLYGVPKIACSIHYTNVADLPV